MLIHVIPLKHSLSTWPFTYMVSDTWKADIQIGGLVEIPIGRHIDLGIVASLDGIDTGVYEVKPIISVRASIPLLTPSMIQTILILSKQYLIPIHKIISLFLPAPLLSRLDKKNYILPEITIEKNTESKRVIHHYQDRIFGKQDLSKYSNPGTVFSFPNDLFVFSFLEEDPSDTLVLTGEATPTRKSQAWIDICGRKNTRIIWTRRILYYNLKAYTHLVYVEESFGSEHFQYPARIRNLDILRSIADTSDIDITIIASSPTLSLFADFRDFSIESIHT